MYCTKISVLLNLLNLYGIKGRHEKYLNFPFRCRKLNYLRAQVIILRSHII